MLLGLGWLWFRDSSFVAIKRVRIVGVGGPHVHQIDSALRNAALSMSTLDVNMGQLRTAVAPYPDVRTLTVRTRFPHGIVIEVHEQVPIAAISVDARTIAVSEDGTLLQSAPSTAHLPTIPLRVPPAGSRLSEPGAAAALAVLASAPYGLLTRIANATRTIQNGVVVQLRDGPQLRFGPANQLAAKWASALAVLGSAGARGAQYIDVSDPRRPAAGVQTSATASPTSAASATSATAASSASAVVSPNPTATASTPAGSVSAPTASGSAPTGGAAAG